MQPLSLAPASSQQTPAWETSPWPGQEPGSPSPCRPLASPGPSVPGQEGPRPTRQQEWRFWGAWPEPGKARVHFVHIPEVPQDQAGPVCCCFPLSGFSPGTRNGGIPALREGNRHRDTWVASAWEAGVMRRAGDAQNSITLLTPSGIIGIPLFPGAETPAPLGQGPPWGAPLPSGNPQQGAGCQRGALLKGWGRLLGLCGASPSSPS